ncbi:MAG TPA: histidine kinase [Candidatus Angelobacter sp.]|nr:histidine kinase [Candidatus Angelobacter sp.]
MSELSQRRSGTLRRVWTVYLLLLPAWISLIALGTWISHKFGAISGRPIAWSRAATLNMVAYSDWALVLTPIVLYLAWSFPIELKTLYKAIPVHVAGMFCMAAIDSLIRASINGFAYPGNRPIPFGQLFERMFLANAESDVWMYWVISVTAFVISYYLRFREKEMKTLQLETQLERTQLSILKMQLQPHFLFNTLHSISALMHQDVKAADKMISCLGDLLRMSIAGMDSHEVAVKQELDFLDKYLEIQQIRFQGRLSVELRIAPNVLGAAIPYLLLQPLVENAIKHGISKRTQAGNITVEVHRALDELRILVANDGPSVNTTPSSGSNGIGLSNIQVRLQTLYGTAQRLDIRHLPGNKTEVEIAVPFRLTQEQSNNGTVCGER